MADTPTTQTGPSPETPARRMRRERSIAIEIAAWVFLWIPLVVFVGGFFMWALAIPDEERPFYIGLAWLAGPATLVIVGLLGLLGFNAIARSVGWARRRRGMAVLGYLENAVRLNFPLDRFLSAAEESERGMTGERLADLREALARGMPVGSALEVAVPEVLVETARGLRAAEGIGQLRPALSRLMAGNDRRVAMEPQTTPFYRFYFPLMVVGVLGTASFFCIFVAPKFRDIFRDFHTTLPPMTQWLLNVASGFFNSGITASAALFVLLLVLIILLARVLQQALQRVRGVRRGLFFMGFSVRTWGWYVPLWRQLLRDRSLGEIMEFMGDALRAGLPLVDAVEAAMELGIPESMRVKLSRWRTGMLAGLAPAEAARKAGLPGFVNGFLETGSGAAGLFGPELFEFLARYYRGRFSRLAIFLRAAAEPVAAIVLGILVGGLVYAMFVPLVALINGVIQHGQQGFL